MVKLQRPAVNQEPQGELNPSARDRPAGGRGRRGARLWGRIDCWPKRVIFARVEGRIEAAWSPGVHGLHDPRLRRVARPRTCVSTATRSPPPPTTPAGGATTPVRDAAPRISPQHHAAPRVAPAASRDPAPPPRAQPHPTRAVRAPYPASSSRSPPCGRADRPRPRAPPARPRPTSEGCRLGLVLRSD